MKYIHITACTTTFKQPLTSPRSFTIATLCVRGTGYNKLLKYTNPLKKSKKNHMKYLKSYKSLVEVQNRHYNKYIRKHLYENYLPTLLNQGNLSQKGSPPVRLSIFASGDVGDNSASLWYISLISSNFCLKMPKRKKLHFHIS